MSNMSYCRFENTSRDMCDCAGAVERIIDGTEEGLHGDELHAAESLIQTSIDMLSQLLDAAGLDWEAIEDIGVAKKLASRLKN